MLTLTINTFCQDLSPILKLLGDFLSIFKILLLLILITICIFDLGKGIVSSKSEDIKKCIKIELKKLGACIFIFFIPLIVMVVFGFVDGFEDITKNSGIDYRICYDCMFNPSSKGCLDATEIAEANS